MFRDLSCPWSSFVRMASILNDSDEPDILVDRMHSLSGFDELREILSDNLLHRASILRCHRILRDARAVMNDVRYSFILAGSRQTRRQEEEAYWLPQFDLEKDRSQVAADISSYLQSERKSLPQYGQLDLAWKDGDRELSALARSIAEYNADFGALLELDRAEFSNVEKDDLRALLGMYGVDTRRRLRAEPDRAECLARQALWRAVRDKARRDSPRRRVAGRAYARLGSIVAELDSDQGAH